MNRRSFLKNTSLGGLLTTAWPAWAASSPANPPKPPPVTFTTAPVLQNPAADAMTVAIGVSGPSSTWIEYGETEQLGSIATGTRHGLNRFDSLAHHIRLESLKPGQRYFYQVCASPVEFRTAYDIRRGDAIRSRIFSFQTFNPQAEKARFVVWNDTHENATTMFRLMERTGPLPSDFHVWNGDVTNDNYREPQMVDNYLDIGGQPYVRETPLLFVRGNHDTRGPVARLLPRFVETPGGRFYYSFRHGPLAGVVLDSGEDKPDTTKVYAGLNAFAAYFREQTEWLKAELKKPHLRKAKFRVAFVHIPFWWEGKGYAANPEDARSAWHPLLAKAGFSAVISGHTHKHALFPPDAKKPYAQMVGGGPKVEAATLIRGEVTHRELALTMTNLEGHELLRWQTRG